MIRNPICDRECLARLHARAPVYGDRAKRPVRRFASVSEVVAYVRRLPERDEAAR